MPHYREKTGLILFLCFITLISTLTILYTVSGYPNDFPEAFKGKAGGIIFSGQNNSNIVACPWVINTTDDSIIGPNDIFREYLSEDLSLEIQKYPLILGFNLVYTHIMHEYDDFYQGDPYEEDSTFDCYYGVVDFDCNSNNDSDIKYWDKTIAPKLELTLSNKWYVSRFEFAIVQKKGRTAFGYTHVESCFAFLLLGIMTIWIFKKK